MPTVLLDENIDGYAAYLSGLLFSSAWGDISRALDGRLLTFGEVGLAKGSTDEQIWEFCQRQQHYLLTDNRNQDRTDSLEAMIRGRPEPGGVPVFTISDLQRLRSDRAYANEVVAKLLEYVMDAASVQGTGRLYLP